MIIRAPTRLALVFVAALITLPATAGHSPASRGSGRLDDSEHDGFIRIDGAAANDQAGDTVAGPGDVNGDSRVDVLLDADYSRPNEAGTAAVAFGGSSRTEIDLAALGKRGFRIFGTAPNEGSDDSFSVAGAGDVNGDGRADVLVGEALAANNGRLASGSVYVVFGQNSPADVDLATLGRRGFRIDGAAENELAGVSVAAAGDVNGDGREDVLVGAKPCCGVTGSVYVVFGQNSPSNLDLATLGTRGFRIDGAASLDGTAVSIAPAGDLNGDGKDDVLVGSNLARFDRREQTGAAYVVFGQSSPTNVSLAALGTRGFAIVGVTERDFAGTSVARAGDVNGDGRADLLVGASYADNSGREQSGSAYVVFGESPPRNVDLAALGTRGFRIDGAAKGDRAGESVAGAGDVNGDGKADVVVGAEWAVNKGRGSSGAAYVVFGQSSPSNVDLKALGTRGFGIIGATRGDFAGTSVAGAGDVNGDGKADVLVGANYAGNRGRKDSGSAYLVFGKTNTDPVDLGEGIDTTPPKLGLSVPGSQRLLRQKGVLLTASCSEACTLKASGAVDVGRATKLPLTSASAKLNAPGRRTLKLALTGRALERFSRAFAQGKQASAAVAVRAVDKAGNATSARQTVPVRR